jgi:hypothetical protein
MIGPAWRDAACRSAMPHAAVRCREPPCDTGLTLVGQTVNDPVAGALLT